MNTKWRYGCLLLALLVMGSLSGCKSKKKNGPADVLAQTKKKKKKDKGRDPDPAPEPVPVAGKGGASGGAGAALAFKSFTESFDGPLSDQWRLGGLQDASRMELVSDPCRAGKSAVKITVKPGDQRQNKNRAEITIRNEDGLETEGWYAWSFMIPKDFKDTVGAGVRQTMGQFHDMKSDGVSWDDFEGKGPPLSIRYGSDGKACGISIWYGISGVNRKEVARVHFEKGEWVDLMFHIKWALDDSAFVAAYVDGKPVTPNNGQDHKVYGRNMFHEYPVYLRLGIYRSEGFKTTNSVYYDELRIGATRREVELQ
jgi:hypothetical protein